MEKCQIMEMISGLFSGLKSNQKENIKHMNKKCSQRTRKENNKKQQYHKAELLHNSLCFNFYRKNGE